MPMIVVKSQSTLTFINVANWGDLAIEGLCGQPEKMADGARPIRDLQPPFWAVAKPCDGVADHIRACSSGLVPSRFIIQQVDGHVA